MMKYFACLALVALVLGLTPPASAQGKAAGLEGAWQHLPFATRVEIAGDTIVVLWQNAPILETKFTVTEEGEKLVLHLAETQTVDPLRGKSYIVTGCWVEDGKMHLGKHFDIAGDSEEVLEPTTEGRYGAAELVTERVLPRIEGLWKVESPLSYAVWIYGDEFSWRDRGAKWEGPLEIVVLHENDEPDPERFRVAAKDPSLENLGYFTRVEFKDGKLIAHPLVQDGDSPELVFERVREYHEK